MFANKGTVRGDMIEVYKILTKKYDTITSINFSFETQQDSRTKGHNLKLVCHRHHCDLIKKLFIRGKNRLPGLNSQYME